MNEPLILDLATALELFQPNPDILYSLDAAAELTGASRRAILVYCRADLVRPILLPPYDMMAFTEESILTIRQIEQLQSANGLDLAAIKTMFALVKEVERLRAELRFWRKR